MITLIFWNTFAIAFEAFGNPDHSLPRIVNEDARLGKTVSIEDFIDY